MSEVALKLSEFMDDFISKKGNSTDKKIWEKKGKKWLLLYVDSKISKGHKKGKKKETSKRPLTAYNLYVKEEFPSIQKEFPGISPQNVMKEIGKRWRDTKVTEAGSLKIGSVHKKEDISDNPAEEEEPENHKFFVFDLFNSWM